MSRTTHYAAAGCFILGLICLLNPSPAQARRPFTTASKTYSSGKFTGKSTANTNFDAADDLAAPTADTTTDNSIANGPTCQPVGEPSIVVHSTTPVHVYKPLHVSLPHATRPLAKIAATQYGG